jgi:hypothetical protein
MTAMTLLATSDRLSRLLGKITRANAIGARRAPLVVTVPGLDPGTVTTINGMAARVEPGRGAIALS